MINPNNYSPREMRPLTLMEKKIRMEAKRNDIEETRKPLIERKKEIELLLSEYTNKVKGRVLPQEEYEHICNEQAKLKREKFEVEKKVATIKEELRKLKSDIDCISLDIKRTSEEAKDFILEVRDKYLSFAADTTRVSSMRAMASKFVEELQYLLSKI